MKSNLRNEIKSYIVRQGMTMQEVGCFTNRRIFNETTVQYSTVYETEP